MTERQLPSGARVEPFPSPSSTDRQVDRRRQLMTMLTEAFAQSPPNPSQRLASLQQRPGESHSQYCERLNEAWAMAADSSTEFSPPTPLQQLASLQQRPGETVSEYYERFNEAWARAVDLLTPPSSSLQHQPMQSQPSSGSGVAAYPSTGAISRRHSARSWTARGRGGRAARGRGGARGQAYGS